MPHALVVHPAGRTLLSDAAAGALTAVVFYAEYVGLGAAIGDALPGRSAAALGSLMVVAAVVVSSMSALAVKQPFIAGPRAASLAVLIFGMKFAVDQVTAQEERFAVAMAALATMLAVAAPTLLLGLLPAVQRFIGGSHVALRKGFVFATAVGIVVGLGGAQLDSCLQVSPALTTVIAAVSVGGALAWQQWCRRKRASRPWLAKLTPLSMMVGVGLATAGYYATLASAARAGFCGTLGSVGLQFRQLGELVVGASTFQSAAAALPGWVWIVLVVIGLLQGGVLLLESLTTLSDRQDTTGQASWASQLKLRALVNLLCAPLGLASSSLSAARTTALVEANGSTRAAVFFHGVALLAILVFCSAWIAKLPNLAVAVSLILVAIQMVDEDTRNHVWRVGYQPFATKSSIRVTWLFWFVLGLSIAAGCALRYFNLGFGGGPLIALVVGAAALPISTRKASLNA